MTARAGSERRRHGLSFDVEDWEYNIRQRVGLPAVAASRSLADQVRRVLDLCDEIDVRATFFVVGEVGRRSPELVRDIAARGHEIGCHSDTHQLTGSLTRAAFRKDTLDAKHVLEDISGCAVVGYRAPEFSVGSLDHWCFAVLEELGFEYDSSVYPVRGPRYGIPDAPRTSFVAPTTTHLVELPLLSLGFDGASVPAAGGTYYRFLPRRVLHYAVRSAERAGRSAVLYFHPYEFSDEWLRLRGEGLRNFRALRYLVLHNVLTRRISANLASVVSSYTFGTLGELASRHVVTPRAGEAS